MGQLSLHYEALSVEASKQTTAEEIVACIVERLNLTVNNKQFFPHSSSLLRNIGNFVCVCIFFSMIYDRLFLLTNLECIKVNETKEERCEENWILIASKWI